MIIDNPNKKEATTIDPPLIPFSLKTFEKSHFGVIILNRKKPNNSNKLPIKPLTKLVIKNAETFIKKSPYPRETPKL